MSWKGNSSASFSGGSGQMAVMGELLHRQCNAAVPHIDVGMDVFAFRDDREDVARIQVKTAPAALYKKGMGYSAKFGVPMAQLKRTDEPPLFYAFAVRLDGGWGKFVVVSRAKLQELWNDGCGSENEKSGNLELHIQFRPADLPKGDQANVDESNWSAKCGKFNLTGFVNAWETLPPLKPVQEVNPEVPQA